MIALDGIDRDQWPESLRPFAEEAKRQAEISLAGTQLARLRTGAKTRRQQRVYTGVVDGRRAWRGMKVVLAEGQIGALITAQRGFAIVSWRDEFSVSPVKMGACRIEEL